MQTWEINPAEKLGRRAGSMGVKGAGSSWFILQSTCQIALDPLCNSIQWDYVCVVKYQAVLMHLVSNMVL